MYIRELKQKNKDGTIRTYLQIIESYRKNGKVKQRIVANLGRKDSEITEKKIEQVMKKI